MGISRFALKHPHESIRIIDARQDPLSHHAVVIPYRGQTPLHDPIWGPFTCGGGARDGQPCEPTDLTSCGDDGVCGSRPTPSVGCIGFMGGASSLGLGLALARPDRRVLVLDGDGSLLMQLGSLATIAGAAPRNLVHFLFKNGVYQTSGAQWIPGGFNVDFVTMASGAGYRAALAVHDIEDFEKQLPEILKMEGPVFVELHTGAYADAHDELVRAQLEALNLKLTALPTH